MLNGLQTNNPWRNLDYSLIRPRTNLPPQFQSALLYQTHGTRHNEAEIANLKGTGITHFVLRLPETIYEPDAQHPQPWLREPIGYAEDVLRTIARFVRAGVLDYVVGPNEANIFYHGTGMTPTKHAEYLQTFITHIRTRKMRDGYDLPEGVRLGLPPVAWEDKYPYMPWLGAQVDVAQQFDFLPVHTYYQSGRHGRTSILQGPLRWQQFGANYEFYQGWQSGMPIMVTEWGNSIHVQGILTPEQVQELRMEDYPIWLEVTANAGIEAAHVFISEGATPDWTGFKINPALAAVMGSAIKHLPAFPVPPQNRVLGEGRVIT